MTSVGSTERLNLLMLLVGMQNTITTIEEHLVTVINSKIMSLFTLEPTSKGLFLR